MHELTKQIDVLSPKKRALFELLLKEQAQQRRQSQVIPRRPAAEYAPVSFGQQQMWVLDQIEPDSFHYNTPAAIRLKGNLNTAAMESAIGEIVRRHDVLRTTFAVVNDEPVQRISAFESFALPLIDISHLPESEREQEAVRLITAEERQPFELARGPLYRATLVNLGPEDKLLMITMHHIVTDGWSMDLFFRELAELYDVHTTGKESNLPQLPIQYADYAAWQREWLQGDVLASQL